MNDVTISVLLIAGGLGTLLLRASFLTLVPGDRLPNWARRGLRYVPPSVLAALAVPAFVPSAWPPEGPAALVRPLAAIAAVLVAWKSGNIFVTIGTGMGVLWVLNALI